MSDSVAPVIDAMRFRRYRKTIDFVTRHCPPPQKILDLGVPNRLSELLSSKGYTIENTKGEDLDIEFRHLGEKDVDLVTAFQILEHMVAPFNLLRSFRQGQQLMATVPLKVWFRKAQWNADDPRDRHYHEFEPRQFDMLLEKAGWQVIDSELWKIPPGRINDIRLVFRFFIPTFYAVFARKINPAVY